MQNEGKCNLVGNVLSKRGIIGNEQDLPVQASKVKSY